MVTYPNCKINLGLHVTSKRPDGYHNIESIFLPVPLTDTLSINPSDEFSFVQDGFPIDGDPMSNLVVKAYSLLKKDYPSQVSPVDIQLTKNIPFGAGLGGGSADASFTLKMVNDLFSLHISNAGLKNYASRLGADCPFFIDNHPVYATETGNQFSEVDIDVKKYKLVLLKPQCGVSTVEAYRGLTPRPGKVDLRQAIKKPISEWKDSIFNHFEESIFPKCPEVAELKQFLYSHGALYASMSGSGSSVYGFFNQVDESIFSALPQSVLRYII